MATATETEEQTTPTPEATLPAAHRVCRICYPNCLNAGPFEVKALCGVDVLGLTPPPDAPQCERCNDLLVDHFEDHYIGWIERGD